MAENSVAGLARRFPLGTLDYYWDTYFCLSLYCTALIICLIIKAKNFVLVETN